MGAIAGGQVRNDDFFGRECEVRRIWRVLENGNVLLSAPRRVGKTSIIYNLRDKHKDEWLPIYMDLESCFTPKEFIEKLVNEGKKLGMLPTGWGEKILSRLDNLGGYGFKIGIRGPSSEDWKKMGNDIMAQFVKRAKGKKVLFLFDEFPLMLFNMMKKDEKMALDVLHWARDVRQSSELRFVYAGSIGIAIILRKLNSHDTINDVEEIKLDAYDDANAKGLIKKLLVGEKLFEDEEAIPEEIVTAFLSRSGNLPFFIQILTSVLSRMYHDSSLREISIDLIEKAYDEGVLGAERKKDFKSYYERLRGYYSEEERKAALNILGKIAEAGEMSKNSLHQIYMMHTKDSDDDNFKNLMEMLTDDFYLVCDNDTYSFWSTVLRDWWKKYKSA